MESTSIVIGIANSFVPGKVIHAGFESPVSSDPGGLIERMFLKSEVSDDGSRASCSERYSGVKTCKAAVT